MSIEIMAKKRTKPKPGHAIVYNGMKFASQAELARFLGIDQALVSRRLKAGEPLVVDKVKRKITINGKTYPSINKAAKELGMTRSRLVNQIRRYGTDDKRIAESRQKLIGRKTSSVKISAQMLQKLNRLAERDQNAHAQNAGRGLTIRTCIHALYADLFDNTIDKQTLLTDCLDDEPTKSKSKLMGYSTDIQTRCELEKLKQILDVQTAQELIALSINYGYKKIVVNDRCERNDKDVAIDILLTANAIAFDMQHDHDKRQMNANINRLIRILNQIKLK